MPRKKDSKAVAAFKGAEKKKGEVSVGIGHTPVCQSDNPLVQAVWEEKAPPLIRANIVNFATEDMFTDLCFHIVVLRKMRSSILEENTQWFEVVQNYGDGGIPLTGTKESGVLKAYRQWNESYKKLCQSLSLTPALMAGLWNLDEPEDETDELI